MRSTVAGSHNWPVIVKDEIRILLVEDSDVDEALIRRALGTSGLSFDLKRVDTRAALVHHLLRTPPDVVLSDFSIPGFGGMEALEIVQKKCPDVPFIFVTGTLGEEVAIDTMKKGATDYVLKHRLTRLGPSVLRALREAKGRAERRRAEEELRESHDQLRSLSVYLQYVREEERTAISREVHDELGQALTALKLQLVWLATRLPKRPTLLRDKARAMSAQIDEIVHAVQRIATALRPGILDTAGLVAAIEWQAHEFAAQTGIECQVFTAIRDTALDQDLNTAFFRIFQETLTNVMRHARASRVEVRLAEQNGDIVLEVKDNGRGISDAEIHNFKSIGLLGMQERATLLGGKVSWQGRPGQGTVVAVRIPRRAKFHTTIVTAGL
jgi:signal transduction histidine kinase